MVTLWWGDGIEPPAQGVSILCSTYWATAPNMEFSRRLHDFNSKSSLSKFKSPSGSEVENLCVASRLIPIHWVFYYWVILPFLSQGNNTILLIVMEYPSHSNLNCLIVVLRGLGRIGDEFLIHSGLSTSVEWGKPLSIFSFQRTFSFCVGVSPPSHFLTPVCFTNVRTLFWSAKHFVKYFLFFSVVRVGLEPTTI